MNGISPENAARLARMIINGRTARGLTQVQLAVEATQSLSTWLGEAPEDPEDRLAYVSPEEEVVWRGKAGQGMEISAHMITKLEGNPRNPLASHARRGQLKGVVLALGFSDDQISEVNGLAGGI